MTPYVTSRLIEPLPLPQNTQEKPIPSHLEQITGNRYRLFNVAFLAYFHTFALTTFFFYVHVVHRQTILLNFALGFWCGYSITAGAHRLWAHRAYKAKWPLRLFLAIGLTITFQFDIYEWVRVHRVHHKFTDTDADPHNSKRGFFFSQIGWVMVRKHKDVIVKGRTVDMSDLERDWIIMWQKRLFPVIGPLFAFVLPTFIPIYFWGEDFWLAWHSNAFRFLAVVHMGGLVNSVAHMWGTKPYDKNITSTNNPTLSIFALGEGWHNYHHAFPWDYKAAELGNYKYNSTTGFLDLCGKLGLAYDFKVASPEMIRKKVLRTGDGSHHVHSHEGEVWGWGDQDMDEDDKEMVRIINPDKKRTKTQ